MDGRPLANVSLAPSHAPTTVISLPQDLIAYDPEQLRQLLLAALAPGRDVVLVADSVTRIGTAALQLLLAFLRDARRRELTVALSGGSSSFAEALKCSALDRDPDVTAALTPRA